MKSAFAAETRKDFGAATSKLRRATKGLPSASADHLLTIEEQLAAIERGDYEAALRQAAPHLELQIYGPPEFPFITRAKGIDEVRRAISHNFTTVIDQRPQISNVLAQGDVVVLVGSERGTIQKTGTGYYVQFTHRFTFLERALTHIQVIVARADEPTEG